MDGEAQPAPECSFGPEGQSKRPATGHGRPRAAARAEPKAAAYADRTPAATASSARPEAQGASASSDREKAGECCIALRCDGVRGLGHRLIDDTWTQPGPTGDGLKVPAG